jgi:hypothetical protein
MALPLVNDTSAEDNVSGVSADGPKAGFCRLEREVGDSNLVRLVDVPSAYDDCFLFRANSSA